MIRTKFEIMGKQWKVRYKKQVIHEDGESCFGLCDYATRTIYIRSGMTEEQTKLVYWHEYMHAMLHERGVLENTGGISVLAEEIICDTFADFMTHEITHKWKRKKK